MKTSIPVTTVGRNYETWNVALWIQNDEGLYAIARRYRFRGYLDFVASLAELGGDISKQTPDGVAWKSLELDLKALDEMFTEL